MKSSLVVGWLLMMLLVAGASADTWNIDKAHSSVGFSVRHMVISRVHGRFDDFAGRVSFDGENVEKGSVEMTPVVSIDTDDEQRDNHLRSADFFDAEKYPVISFKSKRILKDKGNEFRIVGDLTIKGVTKEVILNCQFNGTVQDPMGNTRAGFSAEAIINRKDLTSIGTKPSTPVVL